MASHLLEHALAFDPVGRDRLAVGIVQRRDVDMALDASRLHLVALEHREIPIEIVAMRQPHGADRSALTVMARRASEFFRRMLQYDLLEVRMRAKRLRRILQALLVDLPMPTLASIHPRH